MVEEAVTHGLIDGLHDRHRTCFHGIAGAVCSAIPCWHKLVVQQIAVRVLRVEKFPPEGIFLLNLCRLPVLAPLYPVDAGLEVVAQLDLDDHRLQQHLGETHVHVLDDIADGAHVGLAGHDDDAVDALVREDLDVVLVKFAEAGGVGVLEGGIVGGAYAALRRLLSRAAREIAVGRPAPLRVGVRVVLLLGGGSAGGADEIVEHGGHVFGLGVLEADHVDLHFRRRLHVERLDHLVEEVHVGLVRDDDKLVGALVGKDQHLAADHAAVGVRDGRHEVDVRRGRRRLVLLQARAIVEVQQAARLGRGRALAESKATGGLGAGGLLLRLLLRLGDDRLERGLDVRRHGVLDLPHEHVLRHGRRHVHLLDDLEHSVHILLRVGDEDGVGTLEPLEETVRVLEALDRLLRLLGGNVLQADHLAYHLALLGERLAGHLHEDRVALRAQRLALERAQELLAERLQHHAVHRERHLDRLQILLLREQLPLKRLERNSALRQVGRGNDRLLALLGVGVKHQLERSLVEDERRHAVRAPRRVLDRLLGLFGGHLLLLLLLLSRARKARTHQAGATIQQGAASPQALRRLDLPQTRRHGQGRARCHQKSLHLLFPSSRRYAQQIVILPFR